MFGLQDSCCFVFFSEFRSSDPGQVPRGCFSRWPLARADVFFSRSVGYSVFCSHFGVFCSRGVSLSRNGVFCARRCFLLPLVGCFLWPPRCFLFPATPSRCSRQFCDPACPLVVGGALIWPAMKHKGRVSREKLQLLHPQPLEGQRN